MTTEIIWKDELYLWKQDRLDDYVYKHWKIPEAFIPFFNDDDTRLTLKEISDFLTQEAKTKEIYPSVDLVFRAFEAQNPKALILGQDPYFNPGSAVGLAFSLPKNSSYINPSFRSIQKEVSSNGFQALPKSGDLSNWTKQGVLLLNSALTVQKDNAGSHVQIWSSFTEKAIAYITNNYKLAIFLWGKDAQSYESDIARKTEHLIIKTSHPMPLSAGKSFNGNLAFLGSKCFSKANDWFLTQGQEKINWSIP